MSMTALAPATTEARARLSPSLEARKAEIRAEMAARAAAHTRASRKAWNHEIARLARTVRDCPCCDTPVSVLLMDEWERVATSRDVGTEAETALRSLVTAHLYGNGVTYADAFRVSGGLWH